MGRVWTLFLFVSAVAWMQMPVVAEGAGEQGGPPAVPPKNKTGGVEPKKEYALNREFVGKKLPQFKVVSGSGETLTREDLEARVAVIFYETRQVVEKNRVVKDALFELAEKAFPLQEEWAAVAMVDTSGANFFTRGIWRKELRKASKKEGLVIYGDWDGKTRETLAAKRDESNIIAVDSHGKVRYFAFGKLDEDEIEHLKSLVLKLRKEQKDQQKQKEAAALKEEGKSATDWEGGQPAEDGGRKTKPEAETLPEPE